MRYFLACIMVLISSSAALGQDNADLAAITKLFTIRNLDVDVAARSAAQARSQALDDAQVRAFDLLLAKLIQPQDRERVGDYSVETAAQLISGIDILQEAASSRRYVAKLNISFNPSNVSSFLRNLGIPHVLSAGKDIAVVHVHQDAGVGYLWRLPLSLQQAREALDIDNRVRRYDFLPATLDWRSRISAPELIAAPSQMLAQLYDQIGNRAVLLLLSQSGPDGVLRYQAYSSERSQPVVGAVSEAQLPSQLQFQRLYQEVFGLLDSSWREQLLVDTGVQGSIALLVDSRKPQDLAAIIKKLSQISLIIDVRVVEVGLPEAALQLVYAGREEQLELALRYGGLQLDRMDAGLYKLRLGG